MYNISQQYDFGFKDVKVDIGAKNYVDYNKLIILRAELEEYVEASSIDQYIEFAKLNFDDGLYFDDFEKNIIYKDVSNNKIVQNLICKTSHDERPFLSSLSVTNHFFLVSSLIGNKNTNLDEYVVLIDEVHTLSDVAEALLQRKFSIFNAKNNIKSMLDSLKKQDDFIGKVALEKNLQTLFANSSSYIKKYASGAMSGEAVTGEKAKYYLDLLSSSLSKAAIDATLKQIKKHQDKFQQEVRISFINEIKEYHDLQEISSYNSNFLGMEYSPSRGYPTFMASSENPLGTLNRVLWSKTTMFAGVSATITSSFSPTKKEISYGFARIGLANKDSNYEINFYEKKFSKELVQIHKTPSEMPDAELVYDNDFQEDNSPYYDFILNNIRNKHDGKNSIVFCGGYKEADYMKRRYDKIFGDVNTICSDRQKTTVQTKNEFEKDGGILFATRMFNTGVSLEGSSLERLFILKLPYPVATSVRWIRLKNSSMNKFMTDINNEMLISLMQTLGRLQRTKNDSGSIFIYDKRYHTNISLKKRINEILNYYGVIKSTIKQKKEVLSEKERKESEVEFYRLIGI